ncbi:MAG TPA: IS66 family transposase [Rudaea sp.]|nr:IS66 family transposase [Rudaea sp.]
MDGVALESITDVNILHALVREQVAVIAQRDASIAERDRAITFKDTKIDKLTHELAYLRRMRFGAKSEAMSAVHRDLFDESMAADIAAAEAELEALRDAAPATPRPRRKPVRRTLPADLPRETTVHEPSSCDCTACGAALVKIGEHASEKLDVKPMEFVVRRDVYPQYACRHCQTIIAEPVAPAILDRGIAAPGLLAQIAIHKYADHLPLYRQEAIFARHGIELKRNTLAEWIGVMGVRLQPLVDALRSQLLQSAVLHADETPVSQLAPGTGKTKRAYLFAYRSAGDKPIIVFDYCPSRAGKHAAHFLGDWKGALMVDDFGGYKALFGQSITELGCWAHARRKFFDAHAACASPIAEHAIGRIGELYAIEAKLRDLDDTARWRERNKQLAPKLDEFKRWLDDLAPKVLGNSGLCRAIAYTRKRWDALVRVLDDGAYPIDNNPVENAIRPIAVGRKNWLFTGSERAGQRAAAIMSLIATAKARGIEPHHWLADVLTRLPTTKDRDIHTLLPLA